MHITQLIYLHATIREGSFAQAARTLYVTPQAVSKALRLLEVELGLPLFKRDGRNLIPTDFAHEFDRQAEDLREGVDDLAAFAAGYAHRSKAVGTFRFALIDTVHRGRLFQAEDLDPFLRQNPGLDMSISSFTNEGCASAVKNGMIDAALVQGRVRKEGILCRKVTSLRLHAALLRSHPLADKERLSLLDLNGMTLARPLDVRCVLSLLEDRCAAVGARPLKVRVGPSRADRDGFLKEGGVVLVGRDNDIADTLPEATVIPFKPEDRLSVPLCLAHRESCTDTATVLYAFLMQVAKRERGRF